MREGTSMSLSWNPAPNNYKKCIIFKILIKSDCSAVKGWVKGKNKIMILILHTNVGSTYDIFSNLTQF